MLTRRQFVSRSLTTGLATSLALGSSIVQADDNWAAKMFEKTSHDFGVVARGSDSSYRLKLKNIYKETVHIAEVRTTCGCSAGKPSQETLLSLEEAYVEITMDTRKFTRRKDSNVIVVIDQPSYQEVRIPITAYIRTDVVIDPDFFRAMARELEAGRVETLDGFGKKSADKVRRAIEDNTDAAAIILEVNNYIECYKFDKNNPDS